MILNRRVKVLNPQQKFNSRVAFSAIQQCPCICRDDDSRIAFIFHECGKSVSGDEIIGNFTCLKEPHSSIQFSRCCSRAELARVPFTEAFSFRRFLSESVNVPEMCLSMLKAFR